MLQLKYDFFKVQIKCTYYSFGIIIIQPFSMINVCDLVILFLLVAKVEIMLALITFNQLNR